MLTARVPPARPAGAALRGPSRPPLPTARRARSSSAAACNSSSRDVSSSGSSSSSGSIKQKKVRGGRAGGCKVAARLSSGSPLPRRRQSLRRAAVQRRRLQQRAWSPRKLPSWRCGCACAHRGRMGVNSLNSRTTIANPPPAHCLPPHIALPPHHRGTFNHSPRCARSPWGRPRAFSWSCCTWVCSWGRRCVIGCSGGAQLGDGRVPCPPDLAALPAGSTSASARDPGTQSRGRPLLHKTPTCLRTLLQRCASSSPPTAALLLGLTHTPAGAHLRPPLGSAFPLVLG